jgi:3-hydroxymyristoyl/3-hydroxydecanoyl-(acyl carrier protein) dehydratase
MLSELALEFAADHPAFAGHFPGVPIVPGVLLLDAAVHALQAHGLAVTGVASAKFLHPIRPGEKLRLSWSVAGERAGFDIHCGDRRAATGQLRLRAAEVA